MKTIKSFLLGATFASAVLGVGHWTLRPMTALPEPGGAGPIDRTPAVEAAMMTNRPTDVLSVPLQGSAEPGPGFWARWVEDADYRTYMNNLRRLGCPEATLADIVIADVWRLFAESGHGLLDTDLGPMTRVPDAAAIETARDTVIARLLGPDWEQQAPKPIHQALALAGLATGQAAAVRDIEAAYHDDVNRIYHDAGQALTSADRAALDAARNERDQALADVLDPEMLQTYHHRNSEWLATLREDPYFSFSPDELDALFAASYGSTDSGDHLAGREPESEELLTVLGAERYSSFQLSRDFRYQQVHDLARRYGGNEVEVAAEILARWDTVLEESQDFNEPRMEVLEGRIQELLGVEAAGRFGEIAAQWGG